MYYFRVYLNLTKTRYNMITRIDTNWCANICSRRPNKLWTKDMLINIFNVYFIGLFNATQFPSDHVRRVWTSCSYIAPKILPFKITSILTQFFNCQYHTHSFILLNLHDMFLVKVVFYPQNLLLLKKCQLDHLFEYILIFPLFYKGNKKSVLTNGRIISSSYKYTHSFTVYQD